VNLLIPLKDHLPDVLTDKLPNKNNVKTVLYGSIPFWIFPLVPVISVAKADANTAEEQALESLCVEGISECYKGIVLRIRDTKVICYNTETSKTAIFTDKRVVSIKQL